METQEVLSLIPQEIQIVEKYIQNIECALRDIHFILCDYDRYDDDKAYQSNKTKILDLLNEVDVPAEVKSDLEDLRKRFEEEDADLRTLLLILEWAASYPDSPEFQQVMEKAEDLKRDIASSKNEDDAASGVAEFTFKEKSKGIRGEKMSNEKKLRGEVAPGLRLKMGTKRKKFELLISVSGRVDRVVIAESAEEAQEIFDDFNYMLELGELRDDVCLVEDITELKD